MDTAIDLRDVAWNGADGLRYRAVFRKPRWWRSRTGGYDVIGRQGESLLVLKPQIRSLKDFVVFSSGKSQDWVSKLLNATFNAASVTFPATLYFRLWTTTISASSTGSSSGEAAYTGYSAVAVTANTTNFPTSSAGASISNGTPITWGANTGGSETETFLVIADASTAGNIKYWGSITSTTVATGDTPQINTSGLTVGET